MAKRNSDASFRAVLEKFSRELAGALSALLKPLIEAQVAEAMSRLQSGVRGLQRTDGRRAGRLCPVPGCGEAGAGPRNRWFCREHSRELSAAEQKSILERTRRLGSDAKLPTAVPAQRI